MKPAWVALAVALAGCGWNLGLRGDAAAPDGDVATTLEMPPPLGDVPLIDAVVTPDAAPDDALEVVTNDDVVTILDSPALPDAPDAGSPPDVAVAPDAPPDVPRDTPPCPPENTCGAVCQAPGTTAASCGACRLNCGPGGFCTLAAGGFRMCCGAPAGGGECNATSCPYAAPGGCFGGPCCRLVSSPP